MVLGVLLRFTNAIYFRWKLHSKRVEKMWNRLETSGEDVKTHSKRVEKFWKLHSKRVENSRSPLDFFFECLPQLCFMLCFFFYMDWMIMYKWVTPVTQDPELNGPPSIINSLIAMGLGETYSRIGILRSYGDIQSYWTTTKLRNIQSYWTTTKLRNIQSYWTTTHDWTTTKLR